jgi:hypothetical protein
MIDITSAKAIFDTAEKITNNAKRGLFYHAVFDCCLNGRIPEFKYYELQIVWPLVKPILDTAANLYRGVDSEDLFSF